MKLDSVVLNWKGDGEMKENFSKLLLSALITYSGLFPADSSFRLMWGGIFFFLIILFYVLFFPPLLYLFRISAEPSAELIVLVVYWTLGWTTWCC